MFGIIRNETYAYKETVTPPSACYIHSQIATAPVYSAFNVAECIKKEND